VRTVSRSGNVGAIRDNGPQANALFAGSVPADLLGIVRKAPGTFELFTWINEGGLVMDRLIVGCEEGASSRERIPTDVTSVSGLARHLNLSRTQLGRKFAEAEALGSMGWSGPRGRSPLWVSAGFRREYHAAQAVKLAIVDAAFEACAAHGPHMAGDVASA